MVELLMWIFLLTVSLPVQAGLLLAETEFVMQVESDIAPFKDLLMGLFFMTVGMEISVGLFLGSFRAVMGALALLVVGKACLRHSLTPSIAGISSIGCLE